MNNVTSINASQLFKTENLQKEHSFKKNELVKYIASGDFTEAEIKEKSPIEQALYSGKPFYIMDTERDCDGSLMYTLSAYPFNDMDEVLNYVKDEIIQPDILNELSGVSSSILLYRTAQMLYIRSVEESNLRYAF